MKIKVHAQRKFAQGAFIPPSVSANPPERRVDVTPSKDESKHVYYNRISAVSLLDIVAFQNMHSHTEPVVLLERLEEIQESMGHSMSEVDGTYTSPIKNAATNSYANHSKSKPVKPLRYIRPKKTGLKNPRAQRPQNMHLRSRLGSSFKPKSRAVKKKCREKPSAGARALRRRVPSPAESYDMDDDKPLTYIAQVLRRTVALRSDRNLRKRRGEELATTSKTSSKNEDAGSDSDDTDTGPIKPKQSHTPKSSPSNASNGFKVNEGAGTSKQAHMGPLRRESGNRSTAQQTDAGKISTPLQTRSSGTNDCQTRSQTPPRNTSRARLSIQKDELDLKGSLRGRPMMKSNHEMNKMKNRTRPYVKSNDLESKGGSRGRRNMQNTSPSRPQSLIQNNKLNLKTSLSTKKQSTIQNKYLNAQRKSKYNELDPNLVTLSHQTRINHYLNELGLGNSVQVQPTSQNNDLEYKTIQEAQSTSQNKDDPPKIISRSPPMSQMNGLKLRSSWRSQPTSHHSSRAQPVSHNHNLETKSSSQVQQTSQTNNLDTNTIQSQPVSPNKNTELKDCSQVQSLTQNNDLKPKSSSLDQIVNQNNDVEHKAYIQSQVANQNGVEYESSSQLLPTVQNYEVDKSGLLVPSAIQNDSKNLMQACPLSQKNHFNPKSDPQGQSTIQSSNLKLRSSSRVNKNLALESSLQTQLTNKNDSLTLEGTTLAKPTPQNNFELTDSGAQTSQNDKLRSSSWIPPTIQNNNNDFDTSLLTQATSLNNDLVLGNSSQPQLTNQTNNHDLEISLHTPSTSQNNNLELTSTSQTLSTIQNNDVVSSSQGQPMRQLNEFDVISSLQTPLTSQSNDLELRIGLQAQPISLNNDHDIQSSSEAQPSCRSEVDLRGSLQTQTMIVNNDLDPGTSLQAHSSPQNFDINCTSSSQYQTPIQSTNFYSGGSQRAPTITRTVVIHPRNNLQPRPTIYGSQPRLTIYGSQPRPTIYASQPRLTIYGTQPRPTIQASQPMPTIQNTNIGLRVNNIGRLAIQDVDVRNNLLAQLMIPNNELDLIVNPRPLSAIQNYDWNFGSMRSRPTFQNNILGVRPNIRVPPTGGTGLVQIRPRPTVHSTEHSNSQVQNRIWHEPAIPPPRKIQNNNDKTNTNPAAPSTNQTSNLQTSSTARSRLAGDHGFGNSSRPRPAFRSHTYNAPRSLLLNDEIRPRHRLRPTKAMREQARFWNMDVVTEETLEYQLRADALAAANRAARAEKMAALAADKDLKFCSEKTREQQLRAESLAAANRAARAEKMAALAADKDLDFCSEKTREQQLRAESLAAAKRAARAEKIAALAADKERAMTLDEALRECVLTAQTVTAEEAKRMQRRQAIAARLQQLSEGSSLSRRNAIRRITHTDTGVNGQHSASEKQLALSPRRGSDSEPEPGPSKLRRKKQSSSPGDPESVSQSRPAETEPLPQKEQQPEPDPGSSEVRKKKPTAPEDPEPNHRSPDREEEPDPGPYQRRRKRRPTLLSGLLKNRLRGLESQAKLLPRTFPTKNTAAGTSTESKECSSESSECTPVPTVDSKKSSAMSTSSLHAPSIDPAIEEGHIETPADQTAQSVTPVEPIVGGWPENSMLSHADLGVPHFKVPRIPASRKSIERRLVKPHGSEQDDLPSSPPATETNAAPTTHQAEPTYIADVPLSKWENFSIPSRENLVEPIIQPNACLSKHYTTVRSIVLATDSELADRCGHCIFCNRIEKIRKLSDLVQNQRKPAAATNEVYDFDADREDSHENTRLYNFRQNRKAKILEPASRKDAPKDPVYLDVLPAQNQHIIEITSVQMANQSKPMLRARLIRKTDANLENEFSLIEHENLLDQLLEIKIANSDQAAKRAAPVETEEPVAGPSNAEPVPSQSQSQNQTDVTDSADDVELNYETDDSTEFLARLQTRLNTRKKTAQSNLRTKAAEKQSLQKKACRTEAKKQEPPKKAKGLRKGHVEAMHVVLPRNYMSSSFSHCFREAPIFYPNEDEFLDPLAYFEKIYPVASQFGLCKVVAPSGFKPKCTITDDVRFNVANQYISRLYCRWGAASKEMCAIKAYLAEQKVFFTRPPLIEGIELNLPKLYRTVQRHGGLKKVIEKKRWGRVAEDMKFPRGPRSAKRIDQLYVKHLLPYDTLSSAERRELMDTVEHSWNRNYKKMLNRASNPLHRQKRLMGESESSDEMDTDEDANLAYALAEAEDCVVTGRCMKLSVFKKVAANVLCTLFPNSEQPTPQEVEQEYWTLVSGAAEHVCVNAASIDTGEEGYGFPRAKYDPYSRHPWNLKMFSQNSGNVLRSLGPVLGVTVPTLHLGMVFATSCWHRDPHGLPWVEYMHHGPPKIWYGIPDELSADFRKAVESLCPTSCQNKSIWLPSDITMIPPHLLHDAKVPLSRVVQSPGEFIVVCPKAYSSSIATGYTESESVYFAPTQWLTYVSDVFQELRASCEPTMFSLSQLLLAVALDERTPEHVLACVSCNLRDVVAAELSRRDALARCGIEMVAPEQNRASCSQARKRPAGAWNVREQDECEICRTTLYLSKVTGLTSKRSSLCLEHALLLIDKDKERFSKTVSGVVATIFVLRAELEDAVRRVEKRLWKRA